MAGARALIGISELAEHGAAEGGAIILGETVHLIGGAGEGIEFQFDKAKLVAEAAICGDIEGEGDPGCGDAGEIEDRIAAFQLFAGNRQAGRRGGSDRAADVQHQVGVAAIAIGIEAQAVAGGGAGDGEGGVDAGITNAIAGAEAEGAAGGQIDGLAARRAGAEGGADGAQGLVVVIHLQIPLGRGTEGGHGQGDPKAGAGYPIHGESFAISAELQAGRGGEGCKANGIVDAAIHGFIEIAKGAIFEIEPGTIDAAIVVAIEQHGA